MNSRIEISLDEYNSYKKQIKELKDEIGKMQQERISMIKSLESYRGAFENIKELEFFDRVLHWKKNIKDIEQYIVK